MAHWIGTKQQILSTAQDRITDVSNYLTL
jgi:hypothetical protein